MKKWIVGGLAILSLAAVGCAESTVEQRPDPAPEKRQQASVDAKEALDDYRQEEVEQPAAPQVARVGDSITVETEQSEAKLTVESVTDPIEPYVDPYFDEAMDQPQSGNRFFGVTVQVENTGSAPIDPGMEFTNALVMRNGIEAEEAIIVDTKPWSTYNDAKIAPGASLRMNLPFEAPASVKADRFQMSVYTADFDETTAEWKLG